MVVSGTPLPCVLLVDGRRDDGEAMRFIDDKNQFLIVISINYVS